MSKTCKTCKGEGWLKSYHRARNPEFVLVQHKICPNCKARGEVGIDGRILRQQGKCGYPGSYMCAREDLKSS